MATRRWITGSIERGLRVLSVFLLLATLAVALGQPGGAGRVLAAEFAAGDSVVVDTDALNLRTGAGLSHAVTDVLVDGEALVVLDGPRSADGYSWYKVRHR